MSEKNTNNNTNTSNVTPSNFIRDIIDEDLRNNKNHPRIMTRFPPEPNGYLHIGHARSICLNFGIAEDYNGIYNLRFDDTDPTKEDMKYVEAIKKDIKWLGFDWEERLYFASDYFDQLYNYAVKLIKKGKAYVDDLSSEEIKEYRGNLTEPGKNSPYRERSIAENLELFEKMKKGEYKEGEKVLRAKIDMAASNLIMRDPPIYRVKYATHYRTGKEWCIYPMYDFAHGLSDAIEGITHSLCTLEFENNRVLYDWFIAEVDTSSKPKQIEFAKLLFNHIVLSKRNLLRLVKEGYVEGWDDPRMPTLAGMRRRGYPPEAIRKMCDSIGLSKRNTVTDISVLESYIRENLNETTPRVMAVLNPVKIVILNYPEEKEEELEADNHPTRPEMGKRKLHFARELYIEKEDFMEEPSKKFYRLAPGKEVRLRYGYYIKCEKVLKDEKTGEIKEIHCTYDPETKGGNAKDGRKVKATLHWLTVKHAIKSEARLYDRLFTVENPMTDEEKDFTEFINPECLKIVKCFVEPSLKEAKKGERYQFERLGYYCLDTEDSNEVNLVFNRTITLKDNWTKTKEKN